MPESLAVVAGVGILLVLTGCSQEFSVLSPASTNARSAAGLWWGMFIWFTIVLLGVIALWLYAIKRSPGKASDSRSRQHQKRWLIWGGLVLPITSMAVILAFGIPAGHRMLPVSQDNGEILRIDVTAHQWRWDVRYPKTGIRLADELHIPVKTAVDVHLTSADVIHSFWVPRLGGKLDMLPGRTNVLRLNAESPGVYRGQCAEFCGTGHAHMKFTVIAHSPDEFRRWQQRERGND